MHQSVQIAFRCCSQSLGDEHTYRQNWHPDDFLVELQTADAPPSHHPGNPLACCLGEVRSLSASVGFPTAPTRHRQKYASSHRELALRLKTESLERGQANDARRQRS